MEAESELRLVEIKKISNLKVLTWNQNYLYVSRGYTLFRISSDEIKTGECKLEKVASFQAGILRQLCSANRILERLLRIGFHAVRILTNSKIIGIIDKHIVVCEPNKNKFRSVFKIQRGTRPLGLAVTPDGRIYWGEYFDNPKREKVHIYGSEDGGNRWKIVYSFPEKTIRHIHNIFYDEYEKCFWVLTGDEDKESKILKASLDWQKIEIVLEGSQQTRAATLILKEDCIFYATDTPHEQNHIYRMDRKTKWLEKVHPISGPSMWSCEVIDHMFFSSASEPGKFYSDYACLFGGSDGGKWMKLIEWPKDNLSPRYFQFGNVTLPVGNRSNLLASTGVAINKEDGITTLWRLEEF